MENLTALCYDCNQLKGNLLYVPMGFYVALIGTQRLIQMQNYVADWFKSIREEFDIERFPLIAPNTNLQMVLDYRGYNKIKFIKDLLVQWQFVGEEQKYTIEAVTDINVAEIRKMVNTLAGNDPELPVALYSLHKVTNDRIMAVAAVSYEKNKRAVVYIPWCEVSKNMRGEIVQSFVQQLFNAIEGIAGYKINGYTVYGLDYESVSQFKPEYLSYEMSGDIQISSGMNVLSDRIEWIAEVENRCFSKLHYEIERKKKKEDELPRKIVHNHAKKKKKRKQA